MQQVFIGRVRPISRAAFNIFPGDLKLGGLRVVRKALQGILVVFLNVLGARIPTVRASLALCILNADLVGGSELGTGVVPRPAISLLAEKTLGAVLVAVTILTHREAFAVAVFAKSRPALKTALACPAIVQVLAECGHLATVSFRLLVVEL